MKLALAALALALTSPTWAQEFRATISGVINDAPLLWLFVTGAVLVAATLIYYGATATGGRPDQTYTPPRMKDGQIEPGQIK